MDERLTVIGAQIKLRNLLRGAGVENAEGEAKMLLQEALGMDPTQLVLSYRQYACSACVEQAFAWAARRSAGEPLQYILGHAGFMGLDIRVAPGVLIPRPETEGLCEMLLEEAKRRKAAGPAFGAGAAVKDGRGPDGFALDVGAAVKDGRGPDGFAVNKEQGAGGAEGLWPSRILDLCTGSGCLAAWAASAFPRAEVVAADLSEEALAIARENCAAYESRPGQVTLLQGDLFAALDGLPVPSSNGDGPEKTGLFSGSALPEAGAGGKEKPCAAAPSNGDGSGKTGLCSVSALPEAGAGGKEKPCAAAPSNGDGPCAGSDSMTPLFDVILSNPPYIPSATLGGLLPEVRDHEPRLALDGGKDGMDVVRRIIEEAPDRLAPGGLLLMEIDDTQEAAVLDACCASVRWDRYEVLRDLAGRVRYLRAFVRT
ncbi:MAG: peptide chain release factor N(5)-glutamine methyltransferase [Clostridia bacterium]|nr:peptide chain release factor N(5)-glutamine methyltransferase [Clostridia bacterium]